MIFERVSFVIIVKMIKTPSSVPHSHEHHFQIQADTGRRRPFPAQRPLPPLRSTTTPRPAPVAAAGPPPPSPLRHPLPSDPERCAAARAQGGRQSAGAAAVQGHVLPNALDTTAIDWVNAAELPSPVNPGSAVRLTLAKVKEGVEVPQLVEKVAAATKAAGEAKGAKVSLGENFSPARAKGYQFGMVAVFDSVEELDAVEGDGKVEEAKAAVRPLLDEVLVLDFVAGPAAGEAPTPASL